MPKIIPLKKIKKILNSINIIPEIEKGFVAYSKGQATVPPIGELIFEDPPGEVHIKYGHINHDSIYVVKIASGFHQNSRYDLPSGNGIMLVFSKKTGEILAILHDEGYLTDIRTAAAGAIVAHYLAPKKVERIGILGSGTQATLQLLYLKNIIDCKEVIVWGRNEKRLENFKANVENSFTVTIAKNIEEITTNSNFIITTTPALKPLLYSKHIQNGTHITAIGADSPHKQELDPFLFQRADIVVTDSISQSMERGDIAHAIKSNLLKKGNIKEIGNIITGVSEKRISDHQLTIASLPGLAVQDIQIAKCIYNKVAFNEG